VVIGIEDTIERRWGPKIKARGIYRDAVHSTKGQFVETSGLSWLSLMVIVPIPCRYGVNSSASAVTTRGDSLTLCVNCGTSSRVRIEIIESPGVTRLRLRRHGVRRRGIHDLQCRIEKEVMAGLPDSTLLADSAEPE
jgi:hypothetical protein